MAITAGQVTLTGSAQVLVSVPAGPTVVIISNPSATDAIYVGTGPNVSSTNGLAIPVGSPPVTIPGFPGSASTDLYVIGTAAQQASWALSTTK